MLCEASIPSSQQHAVAQAHHKDNDTGKNIANEINCKVYKHRMKAGLGKKQSATTKPGCVTVDGTLYDVVNVILCKKENCISLKESHEYGISLQLHAQPKVVLKCGSCTLFFPKRDPKCRLAPCDTKTIYHIHF